MRTTFRCKCWILFHTVLLVLTVIPTRAASRDEPASPGHPTQVAKRFQKHVRRQLEMNYWLHLPPEYHKDRHSQWPLIVFLHGSGEKGDDVNLVTKHGPPKLVKEQPDFPFIVLSPQCPFGRYTWIADDVVALMDELISRYRVDPTRIYLTGLSMGGYGCWTLAAAYPERFAAVAPLCGGGDYVDVAWGARRNAAAVASLPIWAFHNERDPVVPLSESEDMVKAFRKEGSREVKLTVYPQAGHDCWTETYRNPELYEWFLKRRRDPSTTAAQSQAGVPPGRNNKSSRGQAGAKTGHAPP